MNITITGRKVVLKDSFRERVEKKLAKLDRLFDRDADAIVTVTQEKNRQTVEITIKSGGFIFRAEETAFEMEEALEKVVDVLVRQIRKNKTKLEKRMRAGAFDVFEDTAAEEESDFKIIRTKQLHIKPLDVEEAILQMNLIGHEFFMFRNAQTGEINVVYLRRDGTYGVLEPEI